MSDDITSFVPMKWEALHNAVASRVFPQKALLYLVHCGGAFKIGLTTGARLYARLSAMQVNTPLPLHLVGWRTGDASVESRLHTKHAEHRIHGEWFAFPVFPAAFSEDGFQPWLTGAIAMYREWQDEEAVSRLQRMRSELITDALRGAA